MPHNKPVAALLKRFYKTLLKRMKQYYKKGRIHFKVFQNERNVNTQKKIQEDVKQEWYADLKNNADKP